MRMVPDPRLVLSGLSLRDPETGPIQGGVPKDSEWSVYFSHEPQDC